VEPEVPAGKINLTDLDSRNLKTPRSYTQGYNVQAVDTLRELGEEALKPA
jgi:hypothetical protein